MLQYSDIIVSLNRIAERQDKSKTCDLFGGPYPVPDRDGAETEDAIAEDAAYKLKPGERWITTKTKKRVVLNKKGEVVFGSPFVIESIEGENAAESTGAHSNGGKGEGKGDGKGTGKGKGKGNPVGAEENTIKPKGSAWEKTRELPRWKETISRLKGADPFTAQNALDTLMMMMVPQRLKMLPKSKQEELCAKAIALTGAYLNNFGAQGFDTNRVAAMQKTIADVVPSMKSVYPEFFEVGFAESVAGSFENDRKTAQERSDVIRKAIARADAATLPADAKSAMADIDEAIKRFGSTTALATAREKVKAIAEGGIADGNGNGTGSNKKRTPLADPVFPNTLDELEELPTPASFAKGYTHPRLFVDRSGKKWVLKGGGSTGHAQAEHEASQAYRALGIRAPASKMFGEHRLAEYVEGEELGSFMRHASPEERKRVVDELRADFAADVVLGNHDLIGDEEDNVMIGEDGHVWRVDNGGSVGKRGAGEDDPTFNDGWVDDLWTMRGKSPKVNGDMSGIPVNPQLAKYFGGMDTHEVLQQIASMPLEKAIAGMSEGGANGAKGRKEILRQRIMELRSLADTSKSVVEDGRYMPDYNDKMVRMSYALAKSPFRELASAKTKDGIPLIYDAMEDGFVRTPVTRDFTSAHSVDKKHAESVSVKNKSLDGLLKEVASQNGVELGVVDGMFEDQGKSTSMGDEANKLKVHELVGMGYSLGQIASGAIPDLAGHIKERVQKAAKMYIAKGGEKGDSYQADRDALMFWKAGMMQFFKHANIPTYDPRTNRLLVVRTEDGRVLDDYVKAHQGEVLPAYPRDSHASYSWFQTCRPTNASHLVALSVPISRVTSCDLFRNTAGRNLYNQYNRAETEVGVNAFGQPFVYLGKAEDRVPIANYFKAIADAERKSGKTLGGETVKDDKDYKRKAAPWAKKGAGLDAADETVCCDLFAGPYEQAEDGTWVESDHPRGQPGNAGQFAKKGEAVAGNGTSGNEKHGGEGVGNSTGNGAGNGGVTAEEDAAYMDVATRIAEAHKAGKAPSAMDIEEAMKMVRMAAARAMPNTKVVDEDGLPLVVYHATDDEFTKFDRDKLGTFTEQNGGNVDLAKVGFWFNENNLANSLYLKKAVPVFLGIDNPAEMSFEEMYDGARDERSDGYIVDDTELGGKSFVALNPSQIKSADAVTYDDAGNVIPLSRRFDDGDDIRGAVNKKTAHDGACCDLWGGPYPV